MDHIDTDIAWEECIPNLPLDTSNLPPLNTLSADASSHLDLLDLLNFEPDKTADIDPNSHITHDILSVSDSLTISPLSFNPSSLSCPSQETLSQCTDDSNPNTLLQSISLDHHHIPSDNSIISSGITSPSQSSTEDIPSPPQQSLPSLHSTNVPSTKVKKRRQKRNTKKSNTSDSNSKDSLVLELTTRLASAGAETTALRKRVASLTQENRSLRGALDHANARLVAVAQTAAAAAPLASQQPVVLGLARMSQDVAGRISGALTVNDIDEAPRKKRKRVTGAATTMACVMFMWGAFVGTPGLLKAASRVFGVETSNLPAIWKGEGNPNTAVTSVPVPRMQESWQPSCMTVLKELPDKSSYDEDETLGEALKEEMLLVDEKATAMVIDSETSAKKIFVDMHNQESAKVVTLADKIGQKQPQYAYVLCRDAPAAINSIKSCSERKKRGETCGPPHTISLILPAATAGMDDENETDSSMSLAEVQCSITSIARIPVDSVNDDHSHGRVIATVPQTGTVIRG